VGPFSEIMLDILFDNVAHLPLAEEDHPIKSFPFYGPHKRFRVSICLRRRLHPVRAMAMESFASSIPSIRAMASSLP
jgi:hypothetical protein